MPFKIYVHEDISIPYASQKSKLNCELCTEILELSMFFPLISKQIGSLSFRFVEKLHRKLQTSHIPSIHIQLPLLLTSCISMMHVLQLPSQYRYIIIYQSQQFTLRFIVGGAHSMGFDKCVMPCIPIIIHIIQCSSTAPKRPLWSVPPAHHRPCPSPTSINHWSLCSLHTFVFSRMSYNWSCTVCNLVRVAYFTEQFEVLHIFLWLEG